MDAVTGVKKDGVVSIERRQPMDVSTAAGHFRVEL